MPLAGSYLGVRLDALRQAQNPDGGWGFFPRKQSWLEPTVYASMALLSTPAADRAWNFLSALQASSGGWRPAAEVHIPGWGTALCVTLAAARNEYQHPWRKGVQWLVQSAGAESNVTNRILAIAGLLNRDRDATLPAWPWKPGTSSWVEPTAHALVALKKAAATEPSRFKSTIEERVRLGEAHLLGVRSKDGGWNYGSRAALGVNLPSYPETTALALLGLQGKPGLDPLLDLAQRWLAGTESAFARAWLAIVLRLNGRPVPAPGAEAPSPDLAITALEALAAPEGNHGLLRTGAFA